MSEKSPPHSQPPEVNIYKHRPPPNLPADTVVWDTQREFRKVIQPKDSTKQETAMFDGYTDGLRD